MKPIDLHSRKKSIANINSLVVNTFFLDIFFCFQQKKETHTGLAQHEGKKMLTHFWGELSL